MSFSIADAIREGTQQLREAGVAEPRREAGSLITHVLNEDRTFILTHAEDALTEEHSERFREWLGRRASGEPLQYLTGHQEFFGLDFEVTKDVLIPRPETELLVETALKLLREPEVSSICDVGTGSGCIAISLLHERRDARAVAIDLSTRAIAVAKRNAVRHGVSERVDFVAADLFAAFRSKPVRWFDMIVSNPPYVKENALPDLQKEVRDFEPRTALAAGEDGLDIIRRLLLEAGTFLKSGGHLLFEIGYDQGSAVEELIDPHSWKLLDIHQDLQGIPSTVALEKRTSFAPNSESVLKN